MTATNPFRVLFSWLLPERDTSHEIPNMVSRISGTLQSLVDNYNNASGNAAERVQITKQLDPDRANRQDDFFRCAVLTSTWALSTRGRGSSLEIFLLPTTELVLDKVEAHSRLKLRLQLVAQKGRTNWTLDSLELHDQELETLLKSLFRDLISRAKASGESATNKFSTLTGSLAGSVKELISEKNLLALKLASQQEKLQNQIARDIHDAVIGDLMSLKRGITESRLNTVQISTMIDDMTQTLRDICHQLSPRDLDELGLAIVLKELAENFQDRTAVKCVFETSSDVPRMDSSVELQLYRIVQECLHNIEKYADASLVKVFISYEKETISVSVQDNGKGIQPQPVTPARTKDGGTGSHIMRERTELIKCTHPASLNVNSDASGTKVTVTVRPLESVNIE